MEELIRERKEISEEVRYIKEISGRVRK